MVAHEIISYRVYLMSQDPVQERKKGATIHLKLKGTKGVAILSFLFSEKLPANKKSDENYKTYWNMSQLPNVVDLLRNEKPLYFFFAENTKLANIQTTEEPVGEEESS